MPELPEVETIRRNLAPHVEGRTLRAAGDPRPALEPPARPARARRRASRGAAVERLGRRGKYLIWELEDEAYLLVHLRMTGNLLIDPAEPAHNRVWFELGDHRLAFTDPRRFGTGELALGEDALDAFLAGRLGRRAARRRVHRRAPARARAHARGRRSRRSCSTRSGSRASGTSTPTRRCSARASTRCGPRTGSRARQCAALRDAVVASLEAGIAAKGATIDDFRDPYGVSGTFQNEFLIHLREGEPCLNCERPGAQAARRRARDLRLRALPAAPAGYAAASLKSARRPSRSAATSSW